MVSLGHGHRLRIYRVFVILLMDLFLFFWHRIKKYFRIESMISDEPPYPVTGLIFLLFVYLKHLDGRVVRTSQGQRFDSCRRLNSAHDYEGVIGQILSLSPSHHLNMT